MGEAGEASQGSELGEASEVSETPEVSETSQASEGAQPDKWSREPETLNDPRYKGMEKWELKVKSADGRDSVVHDVRDPRTGEPMHFKFKKYNTEFFFPPKS